MIVIFTKKMGGRIGLGNSPKDARDAQPSQILAEHPKQFVFGQLLRLHCCSLGPPVQGILEGWEGLLANRLFLRAFLTETLIFFSVLAFAEHRADFVLSLSRLAARGLGGGVVVENLNRSLFSIRRRSG